MSLTSCRYRTLSRIGNLRCVIVIPSTPTTGNHLRMTRLLRRVPVSAVARHAGVSRQRIHQVEAAEHPSRSWRTRYLEALDRAERER